MQFYKRRNFGELLNDTFGFIKYNGKNFFKNYLIVNGGVGILMMLFFILGFKEFLMTFIDGNLDGSGSYWDSYFGDNAVLIGIVVGFIAILFFMLMVFNASYPVLYLKRVSEVSGTVQVSDILSDIKKNLGKLAIYFLGILFIIVPLMLLMTIPMAIFSGIFIFLMMISGPFIFNVMNFHLYDYLHTKKGYFESLSYAVRSQFSYPNGNEKTPFWKYLGITVILYFVIYIATLIFTMIPIIIFVILLFTVGSVGTMDNPFESPAFILGFMSIYAIAILASFFLSNLMYIGVGLCYYDSRTDLHRKENLSEIDQIGNGI